MFVLVSVGIMNMTSVEETMLRGVSGTQTRWCHAFIGPVVRSLKFEFSVAVLPLRFTGVVPWSLGDCSLPFVLNCTHTHT